jgi:hypothetical protein
MRRWGGFVIVLLTAGAALGQSSSGSGSSQPGFGLGSGINQPFNEKALFPDAKSLIQNQPGTSPATPPSWNPFGAPSTAQSGPVNVPLIPDGSLPLSEPKRWFGGFEFGVNGSQGNADVLNLRLGGLVDYKTPGNLFHADLLYTLTHQDGTTRQNQALLNARDEILFPNSPWGVFASAQVEYDQFRQYDFRAGAYSGLSYLWVKTDHLLYKTRVGAGAVREESLGSSGLPGRWVPEALVGMDFNYRFTDRQGFLSSLDVYGNLSQLGQYRVRARAGYEILLDPKYGMVLRLGVQDRYDTLSGQSRRNDLNYFATLLFKF